MVKETNKYKITGSSRQILSFESKSICDELIYWTVNNSFRHLNLLSSLNDHENISNSDKCFSNTDMSNE